jgi:hypothetical protein
MHAARELESNCRPLCPDDARSHLLHTSRMSQHTSRMRQHTSAYVANLRATAVPSAPSMHAGTSCIRRHTSAYVSIRQHPSRPLCPDDACSHLLHTSAYVGIRQHTLARVRAIRRQHLIHEPRCAVVVACIRQHTSACVSIRQHTSAYVSIRRSRLHLLAVSACLRTYMRRQLLKRQ